MDPRAAVQRLLALQSGDDVDPEALDGHLDDTALELLSALCTCLSFAVAAANGTRVQHELAREQLGQCVGAINMVLEVWDMAEVEIVDEPFLDEYALGWMSAN